MNLIRKQFDRMFSRPVVVPTQQAIMMKQITDGFVLPDKGRNNKNTKRNTNWLEFRRDSFGRQTTLTVLLGDVTIDQLQQNRTHRSAGCATCKQIIADLKNAYTETGITMCVQAAQKLQILKRDIAREKMDVELVLLETTKEDVLLMVRQSFFGLQEIFPNVTNLTIIFGDGLDEVIPSLVSAFSSQIVILRVAASAGCVTTPLFQAIALVAKLQNLTFIVGHFQFDDLVINNCIRTLFSHLTQFEVFCQCSNINETFQQLTNVLESSTQLTKIVFHQETPIREQLQMSETAKEHFIEFPKNTTEQFEPCFKNTCTQYFNSNTENPNNEKLKPYCYVLVPLLLIILTITLLSIFRYCF